MTHRRQRTSPATRRTSTARRATSGRSTLPGRSRASRTTSGTASSSPTAPTPTTTATTRPALDGGLGAHDRRRRRPELGADAVTCPASPRPAWAKDAVIYQIFPDRFRNGRTNNDPKTGDVRYDDPVAHAWRGACCPRATAATTPTADDCPWRFDTTPPAGSPTAEQPRGRDYMGGDLKGVDQQLDYLPVARRQRDLLQPDLRRGSNHSYDTQDYTQIDPVLRHPEGLRQPRQARRRARDPDHPRRRLQPHVVGQPAVRPLPPLRDGRRLRVGRPRRTAAGSCSTTSAPGNGTCAGSTGVANSATYDGWFGFDSIPVLDKTQRRRPGLLPDRARLRSPSAGSRPAPPAGGMDVSGDPSFPNGYWETFRVGRQGRRSRRADDQRDVAEGLDAAADAPRRPPRHDDELPAPRRGPRRSSRRRPSTRRASPTAATQISAVGLRRPARVAARGLPGRGLLLADEPARQPRHGAAAVDAHAGRRDDRRREGTPRQRGRRQAARAARLADPVHRARRADRLLRRRGRA